MTESSIPDPATAGPNAPGPAAADPTEHSRWRPLRLHARGPMTITELAESVQLTHSAVSQKVAAMRAAGWVRTTPGADARSKKVMLTPKAARMAGRLAAEWRATEAAIAELEAEIPYPLSRVVADIEERLERKSFHDR